MTNKLLSDEELATRIVIIARGIGKNYDDSIDAKLEQSIFNLINAQKRLYAESVIGEDEPERVVVASYGQTRAVAGAATRNTLRAEQRARIE